MSQGATRRLSSRATIGVPGWPCQNRAKAQRDLGRDNRSRLPTRSHENLDERNLAMARAELDPKTSHFLDLARILAALVVVLHHVFEAPFHHGSVAFPGRSAVIVFFVISGYVIAYSTDGKTDWKRYAVARLARIYSVAVPALALSLGLVWAQNALPGVPPAMADMQAVRVVISLLFANQFWNLTVAALTNGPYWSLCYEVWYYVLFGVLSFMQGWPRLLCAAAVIALVGPRILLLLPVWAMGVFAYHAMKSQRRSGPGLDRVLFWIFVAALLLAMTMGTPVDAVSRTIRESLVDGYFKAGPLSVFIGGDARFLSDWALGVLFAACIFLSRCGAATVSASAAWRSLVQASASYTFSLYLYHVPVLIFAHAVLASRLPTAMVPWAMLGLILFAVVWLGRYTEHRKEPWVRLFVAMLGRQARSSA